MKVKGVATKYVLRQAFQNDMPEIILNRKDKIGFKAAPNLTFDLINKTYLNLLENQTEYEKCWFVSEDLKRVFRTSEYDISNEFNLWRIINVKIWARQFWGNS
jgi:hypothetical protein